MRPVFFEDAAQEDLQALYDFYELRERGAGDYLIEMLSATISRLGLQSGFHGLRHGFHLVRIHRFPVGLFYRIHEEKVEIAAVIDLRSDPRSIARRLSNRGV